MAGQILEKTADQAATFKLAPLDLLFVVDENGVRTGEMRIGDGRTAGGYTIDGVSGGVAGVTTWNNASGNVTAGIADLDDVSLAGVSTDDVLKYTGSGFAPGTVDIEEVTGITASGASAGQTLLFNDATGDFEPGDIPAAPSDNLGNHVATQDLNMSDFKLTNVLELNMSQADGIWSIGRALGPTRLGFVRKDDQGADVFPVVISAGNEDVNAPNVDGLILSAYGSSRLSDVTGNQGGQGSTPVTNLAYFSSIGQLLKAPTDEVSIGVFGDVDLTTAAPTDGQILSFNSTSGNFEPGDIPAAPGDDLGNHTATQDLDLAANKLTDVLEINMSQADGSWVLGRALGSTRFGVVKTLSGGSTTFPLVVSAGNEDVAAPNVNGLILSAYGASRLSDVTGNQGGQNSTPVTNLAYFNAVGQLLKAPTDEVSIGVFEDVDLTSIASGDMLYYDGTGFVRVPKGTDGQTLTLVSGVPTWA